MVVTPPATKIRVPCWLSGSAAVQPAVLTSVPWSRLRLNPNSVMVVAATSGTGVDVGAVVAVGASVGAGVAMGDLVGTGVTVGAWVGAGVAVAWAGVVVAVGWGVAVGARVGVGTGVAVGARVGVGTGVAVGLGFTVTAGVAGTGVAAAPPPPHAIIATNAIMANAATAIRPGFLLLIISHSLVFLIRTSLKMTRNFLGRTYFT